MKQKSCARNTSLENITQELTRKHTPPRKLGVLLARIYGFCLTIPATQDYTSLTTKKIIYVYIYIYLCTIQSCNSTRHKIYFTQLGVNCVYNSENKYFFGKLLDVLLFA